MKTPTIKVLSISFCQNPVLRREVLELFPQAILNDEGRRFTVPQVIEYLSDTDGAIVGLEPMNREAIAGLPRLKIISKFGVGLDNVDVEFAQAQGKIIGWTGGVNKRSVAEQTLGFMIGLCRNLFTTGYKLKQGIWDKRGGVQLSGKTVGIIGCGHIGSEVLKLLQPFECRLLICDILDKSTVAAKYHAQQVSLEELLQASHVVSLHVPCTSETRQMINTERLHLMRPEAYLINLSRGEIVDQAALKNALRQQTIAGAALDVFDPEPPTDLEFLGLPNLMVTPHIGGNAREAVEAMGRAAIEHLKNFFLKA